MAKVSFIEINQSELANLPFVDGRIVFCRDSENIYKETATSRKTMGADIIAVDSLPIAPIADKIYLMNTDLYLYKDGGWTILNTITVDGSLDKSSENPVQNNVISSAIEKIDTKVNNKIQFTSHPVPSSGFKMDASVPDYPYYYDISADVTANDRAIITIRPESRTLAISCGVCPTNETIQGNIRVRMAKMPTGGANINMDCWIVKGGN